MAEIKLRAADVVAKVINNYGQKLELVIELMESLFYKDEDLEIVGKIVPNSTWFRSLYYQTEKSWSRQRRVVTKVCYGSDIMSGSIVCV